MRIALLSPMYPFRGGIARFSDSLCEVLMREHEVKAYTFTRQYPAFLFPGKTQYVAEADRDRETVALPVLDSANPLSYATAARRIIEGNPELLVVPYWMSYFAPSLGHVSARVGRKGCRVVSILHNVIPHEPSVVDRPLTKWFLGRSDGFIALSEAVRTDLLGLRPDAQSILLPHPIYDHFGERIDTLAARRQLGLPEGKKTLLFFGLIRDYKGLDLLIEAMDRLDESYQLVIAGEAYGSFDKYRDRIARLRHPENVHLFNHYIDDGEVPLYFSAADVCVLPYRTATQSGITSIALHLETPIIVTPCGGLAEGVERPGIGLVTEDVSAEAIARTVAAFFERDSGEFVENIRREKELLSWETFARNMLGFAETLG